MSIADEVRRALQPLIDQGLVHNVQPGSFATYSGAPRSGRAYARYGDGERG